MKEKSGYIIKQEEFLQMSDESKMTDEQIVSAFFKYRDELDIGIYDENDILIGLKEAGEV